MQQIERTIPPMNIGDAGRLLDEAKQIFDSQGIVFFLRQGTCLGAVRDQALIPWDDDLDLGSIIGLHDFSEDDIAPAVEAFRANGCYVEVIPDGLYTSVKIMKYRIQDRLAMLPGRQRYDRSLPWRAVSSQFVHQVAGSRL